jgi:hypothetical protein
VGSGLIFLLIVGAWLAVLVPMALRSSEAASTHSTVDRFHDAMRVLSRRSSSSPGAAHEVEPAPVTARPAAPTARPAGSTARPAGSPARAAAPAPRRRAGLTPAARRRRAVGVLALLAVASLVGGVVGPLWLLGVHAVADVLLLGVFLWLRHQAVLREEREWRTAMGDRRSAASQQWSPLEELAPAAIPAPAPVAVYGVPDRMPARREIASTDSVFDQFADAPARPRTAPALAPAPAARVPAARGAQGEPWQPVPVPVPMYVTAPRAPRRLVDLTSTHADALATAERSVGIDDQGPELEHILGRRAVGG